MFTFNKRILGQSEYKTHYKWSPSFRSASFVPKPDQAAHDAGVRSDLFGKNMEPGFTIKKKVWHRDPQIQSCLIWWPDDGLDGQSVGSEKPATPVQKEPKEVTGTKRKEEKRSELERAVRNGVAKRAASSQREQTQRRASLDGSVMLAPRRDISTTRRATSRREIVTDRDASPKGKKSGRETLQKRNETDLRRSVSQPTSPNGGRYRDGITSTRSKQTQTPSPKRQSSKVTSPKKSPPKAELPKPKLSPKKDLAGPNENIPLQRKVGLQAGKPSRTSKARLSEYQRNFMPPKFSVKPSPLLSALDVVHASSPAIPPHTGIKFRPTTEYVSKFKKTESPLLSRSLSATSPASPSMKPKVKDMQNPQKPFFVHAKQRNVKTEYSSQYEADKEFQVGELRQMAESNKQKHEGTHIDPNHATQVLSPFNRCWEASSDGSSRRRVETVDEVGKKAKKREHDGRESVVREKREASTRSSPRSSRRSSGTVEGTEVETDSLEAGDSVATADSVVRKLAWGEADEDSESVKDKEPESSSTAGSVLEGRVTTPRLQELGGAQRTHHDLTTPCKGGALLISPSRPRKAESCGSFFSSSTEIQKASPPPVAGAPTPDAHRLLDERAHPLVRSSPGRPVTYTLDKRQRPATAKETLVRRETPVKKKQPVKDAKIDRSPVVRHAYTAGNVRAPIRGTLRNEEFQHCGSTGRLQTPVPMARQQDEDALSVASSLTSARASDLLRRARERKSFWTTT